MLHKITFFDGAEALGPVKPEELAGVSLVAAPTFFSRRAYRYAWSGQAPNAGWATKSWLWSDGTWHLNAVSRFAWISAHFYIEAMPPSGAFFPMSLYQTPDGGNNPHAWRFSSTGAISFWNGSSWLADSASVLLPGRWYLFSHHFSHTGSGCRLIIRDTETGSEVFNATSASRVVDFFRGVRIGCHTANTGATWSGTVVVDNIVIEASDTATDISDPFTLLGTHYAEACSLPDGQGTDNSNWSGVWTDVDENPHDGDTTFRRLVNATGAFTCTMQDLGVAFDYPVKAVHAVSGMHTVRSDGGGHNSALRLRQAATISETAWIAFPASYTPYQQVWTLDPADNQPWNTARYATLELGTSAQYLSPGGARSTQVLLFALVTIETTPPYAHRLLHYILDLNAPDQAISDQHGRIVPPEELRPNRWIAVTGWLAPTSLVPDDYINDPEKALITAVRFSEPDSFSLGVGEDELLNALLARLTQRGA